MHESGELELFGTSAQGSTMDVQAHSDFSDAMHTWGWDSCKLEIRLWNKKSQQGSVLLSKTYATGQAEFKAQKARGPGDDDGPDSDLMMTDFKDPFEMEGVAFKFIMKQSETHSGDYIYGGDEKTTV
jgi:hypothetical protein